MPENNVVLFYLGHISFVDNLNGLLNELTNPWEVKNWLKIFQTVITCITDQFSNLSNIIFKNTNLSGTDLSGSNLSSC